MCRCRCREVRDIPSTAISLKMEPVNSQPLMRCTRSKQPGRISRYFHARDACGKSGCDERIRSPPNIKGDCPFVATSSFLCVFSFVGWMVDHYFLSSNWRTCASFQTSHTVSLSSFSIRYSQSATLFVMIRSPPTGKLLTESCSVRAEAASSSSPCARSRPPRLRGCRGCR